MKPGISLHSSFTRLAPSMRFAPRRLILATLLTSALAVAGLIGASPASAIAVSLDSISPTSGSTAGGDLVRVHGENISLAPNLLFGDGFATLVSIDGVDDITVATPPGAPGAVDVSLILVRSSSFGLLMPRIPAPTTLYGAFTYIAPGPAPWHQSIGRVHATDACPSGWHPSWAQWMNGRTGGFVCDREQYWNNSSSVWSYRFRTSR